MMIDYSELIINHFDFVNYFDNFEIHLIEFLK
jgi:hypothetical protein